MKKKTENGKSRYIFEKEKKNKQKQDSCVCARTATEKKNKSKHKWAHSKPWSVIGEYDVTGRSDTRNAAFPIG